MSRLVLACALLAACGLVVPIGAQTDGESRAVYRYRVAIASMLQLKPGMAAAEVGPDPGFLTKVMESLVAPGGRAVARESIGALDPASLDAVALLDFFSGSTPPDHVFRSVASALKPGGALLIVDVAREGVGANQRGIDAEDALSLAAAAGFTREAESGIVPGHFAIRFRKP
jgi:predicted methyltransferase